MVPFLYNTIQKRVVVLSRSLLSLHPFPPFPPFPPSSLYPQDVSLDSRTTTAVESLLSLGSARLQTEWRPPSPAFSTTSEASALSSPPRPSSSPGRATSPSSVTQNDQEMDEEEVERVDPSASAAQPPEQGKAPNIVSRAWGFVYVLVRVPLLFFLRLGRMTFRVSRAAGLIHKYTWCSCTGLLPSYEECHPAVVVICFRFVPPLPSSPPFSLPACHTQQHDSKIHPISKQQWWPTNLLQRYHVTSRKGSGADSS